MKAGWNRVVKAVRRARARRPHDATPLPPKGLGGATASAILTMVGFRPKGLSGASPIIGDPQGARLRPRPFFFREAR